MTPNLPKFSVDLRYGYGAGHGSRLNRGMAYDTSTGRVTVKGCTVL